jgi:hypothetical protein
MKRLLLCAAASLTLAGGQAAAGIGADVSVGTPGISGNLHFQVTPLVTLRGGYNFFEFDLEDQEWDDINYDAELNFSNLGGYVDLHPMMNGFTLTAGAVVGERDVSFTSRPLEPIEIGDTFFQPEQVGELVGNTGFGDVGYYAGFGWDSTTHGLSPVSLVLRAGVLMTQAPEISLISRGGLADSDPMVRAMLDAELAQEAQSLESDFENFRFFPMISIGIGFGF